MPGGDVNPYLAVAAMIAAGMDGVDRELPLEEPLAGNAYTAEGSRVPSALATRWICGSRANWPARPSGTTWSSTTPTRPGEIAAYDAAVTDWELHRGFERM